MRKYWVVEYLCPGTVDRQTALEALMTFLVSRSVRQPWSYRCGYSVDR